MVVKDQLVRQEPMELTELMALLEQTEMMVTMDIGDRVVGVAVSRIERIVKGRSALDEYDDRAAGLAANDVAGWRSLGLWASHQGLSSARCPNRCP